MPQASTQTQQNQPHLTPSYKILIDGQPMSPQIQARVISIKAESNLEILDMFELRLYDYDLELVNSDELAIGKAVEIKLGYQESQLASVATCEIVSWEPEYPSGGPAFLTVRGYDRSFRLSREKKSRSFLNMKDSDIAAQIAREMNLTPCIEPTAEVHQYVFQRNQANLEFLLERAQRILYEVYIEGTNLYFRNPLSNRSRQVTLKWGESLAAFAPRLSSFNQVSEVIVKGWDPRTKKEIIGIARGGAEHAILGGAVTASQIAEAAHGATKTFKVDQPIQSLAEAESLARAHFNLLSMNFITGEGRALGDPAIKAGAVIDMEGLGDKFSGSYYVVRATHIFSSSGYTTFFEVKKNSLGRPTPPPPPPPPPAAPQTKTSFLDVTLVDEAGGKVSGKDYIVVTPDGTKFMGTVGSDGKIRKDNLPPGACEVIFKELKEARWSVDQAEIDEEVGLSVECPAFSSGDQVTFEIYELYNEEASQQIASLNGSVDDQGSASATWKYKLREQDQGTKPMFIFKASAGSLQITSDVLTIVNKVEAALQFPNGDPYALQPYTLILPDGTTREGMTDEEGKLSETDLPLGDITISMEES